MSLSGFWLSNFLFLTISMYIHTLDDCILETDLLLQRRWSLLSLLFFSHLKLCKTRHIMSQLQTFLPCLGQSLNSQKKNLPFFKKNYYFISPVYGFVSLRHFCVVVPCLGVVRWSLHFIFVWSRCFRFLNGLERRSHSSQSSQCMSSHFYLLSLFQCCLFFCFFLAVQHGTF